MMHKNIPLLLVTAIFALGACSNTKEQLGLNKKSPDEFAVIKHAPLSMPPDYSLRPPQPGAPRPQEQESSLEARSTLLGETQQQPVVATDAESALLLQAGGNTADPAIRQKINHEAVLLKDYNKPVAQKLLGIGGDKDEPSATVVNAKEENERLKKNAEAGKPVTEGETPSIEQ